jgi:tetratricopeptide (TPR) repeat protein
MTESNITKQIGDENEKFKIGDGALFDTRQWLNQEGGENVILLFCSMAEKEFNKLNGEIPGHPRILLRLAFLEYRSIWIDTEKLEERVNKCVEYIDKATAIVSGHNYNLACYHFLKGLAYSKIPRWKEAIESMKESILAISDSSDLIEADLELVHGSVTEGKAEYKKFLQHYLEQCLELGGAWDEVKKLTLEELKSENHDTPKEFDSCCLKWSKIHQDDGDKARNGNWIKAALAEAAELEAKWKQAEVWYRKSLEYDMGYKSRHSPYGVMYPSEFFALCHEGLSRVLEKQGSIF